MDDELTPEAEARLQALLREQRERRAVEDGRRRARRGLWLSHHWPDEYDRCAVIGGRHVCRRCLALYPLAFAVLLATGAGASPWPQEWDRPLIWLSCLPATVEFIAEKVLDLRYDARRQTVVTMAVALGLGRGLAAEIDHRWSADFWGPVLVFGTIWFLAAAHRARRTMFADALVASRRAAAEGR